MKTVDSFLQGWVLDGKRPALITIVDFDRDKPEFLNHIPGNRVWVAEFPPSRKPPNKEQSEIQGFGTNIRSACDDLTQKCKEKGFNFDY